MILYAIKRVVTAIGTGVPINTASLQPLTAPRVVPMVIIPFGNVFHPAVSKLRVASLRAELMALALVVQPFGDDIIESLAVP